MKRWMSALRVAVASFTVSALVAIAAHMELGPTADVATAAQRSTPTVGVSLPLLQPGPFVQGTATPTSRQLQLLPGQPQPFQLASTATRQRAVPPGPPAPGSVVGPDVPVDVLQPFPVCIPPVVDTASNGPGLPGLLRVSNYIGVTEGGIAPTIRTLLRFDLSHIPPAASVSSATLRLYLDEGGWTPSADIFAFRATQPWAEPVGLPPPPGFDTNASRTGTAARAAVDTEPGWKTWDVTRIVQAWIVHGQPNHGIVVAGLGAGVSQGNEPSYERVFRSKEWGDGSHAPCLLVTYTALPTATPPPTVRPGEPTYTATPTATPVPTWTVAPPWTPVPTQPPTQFLPFAANWDLEVVEIRTWQTLGPDVPLVAGKTTLVRVLTTRSQTPERDATVWLQAYREGNELLPCAGIPVTGQTKPVKVPSQDFWYGYGRSDMALTHNFVLPSNCTWTQEGEVTLRARVGAANMEGFDTDRVPDNDTFEQAVTFLGMRPPDVYSGDRPLRVGIYLGRYEWPGSMNFGAQPSMGELQSVRDFLRDLFPIAWVAPHGPQVLVFTGTNLDFTNDSEDFRDGLGDILSAFEDCCATPGVDVNLLLLDDALFCCPGVGGLAYRNSRHAVCTVRVPSSCAHEIGHTFGLKHNSNNHGEADGGEYEALTPHGRVTHMGWDPSVPGKLIGFNPGAPPDYHSHDVMSYGACMNFSGTIPTASDPDSLPYCHSNWISGPNYARLAQQLLCAYTQPIDDGACPAVWPWSDLGPPLTGSPAEIDLHAASLEPVPASVVTAGQEEPPDERNYLLIRGQVHGDGRVALLPFYQRVLPGETADSPGRGAYQIELQAEDGALLVSRRFQPRRPTAHGSTTRPSLINELVRWHDETTRVVIRRDGARVAERALTANAPRVTQLDPNGGEAWAPDGEVVIRWEAGDLDGDPLAYWVEYSADTGASWFTLGRNLREPWLTVDLANVAPSSDALIRVSASDGIHTAVDITDATFTVAPKAPRVGIAAPRDGAEVRAGEPVRLTGIAIDWEDGFISGTALFWESDAVGTLGSGEEVVVRLSPGSHLISLTATDGDGLEGVERIRILAR